VDECLFAPAAVVRQAKTSGEVDGCPLRKGSLFYLGLGSASKGAANRDLVFLSQSWSRCPAEKWVRALLEGVWNVAVHESACVLCALCFVLCALCFVLCALCFVLCALCRFSVAAMTRVWAC
jgi:hypothetical protein